MKLAGQQLRKSEQNGFHINFLISQPNHMMWPSLKSSLRDDYNEWSHHRVWLREIRKLAFWKLSILELICCPGLIRAWTFCNTFISICSKQFSPFLYNLKAIYEYKHNDSVSRVFPDDVTITTANTVDPDKGDSFKNNLLQYFFFLQLMLLVANYWKLVDERNLWLCVINTRVSHLFHMNKVSTKIKLVWRHLRYICFKKITETPDLTLSVRLDLRPPIYWPQSNMFE